MSVFAVSGVSKVLSGFVIPKAQNPESIELKDCVSQRIIYVKAGFEGNINEKTRTRIILFKIFVDLSNHDAHMCCGHWNPDGRS